jgi:hypothetical protein
MTIELQQRYQIKGAAFGARGCSCSCSPCDCNPCKCGDEVRPPRWRISGYHIQSGTIDGNDVSGLFLLSLAQPLGDSALWQEALLIDENATQEQIMTLLSIFEDQLESLPAEIETRVLSRKALYTIPMRYASETAEPQLHVDFVPATATRLREGNTVLPRPWNYHGPMALREHFALSSS